MISTSWRAGDDKATFFSYAIPTYGKDVPSLRVCVQSLEELCGRLRFSYIDEFTFAFCVSIGLYQVARVSVCRPSIYECA